MGIVIRLPIRHGRTSADSNPKIEGSARLSVPASARSKMKNFSGGIRPRAFQFETAEVPTPHSSATFAGPPSASMTSSMAPCIDPLYSRFVESSIVHDTAVVTDCEQWLDSLMISEREFIAGVAWRVAVLRKAFDLTQVELGEKLGVGDTAIANYEKASRLISPYDALKLKATYATPLEWLYAGDESTLSSPLAAKLRLAEMALRNERQKGKPQRRRA